MRLAKVVSAGASALALTAVAAFLVAGCGGSSDEASTTTATASAGQAKDGRGATGAESKRAQEGGGESAGLSNGSKGANVPQPEGEPEPGITPEQRKKATTASITLASPALKSGASLGKAYTCDGADRSPPLEWSGLPGEAEELVLLVLNLSPVNEELFFDWAVAGLDPSLSALEEGKLPSGAVVGVNSFGKRSYSICPEKGKGESYFFMLYAIPTALSPQPGFDPLALREEVLAQHGNVGIFSASYTRH